MEVRSALNAALRQVSGPMGGFVGPSLPELERHRPTKAKVAEPSFQPLPYRQKRPTDKAVMGFSSAIRPTSSSRPSTYNRSNTP